MFPQSALHALNAITFNSILVRQCMDALNTLSKTNSVTLRWVKAHVGHKLNEEADDLAKCGTGLDTVFPPPSPGRSANNWLIKYLQPSGRNDGKIFLRASKLSTGLRPQGLSHTG